MKKLHMIIFALVFEFLSTSVYAESRNLIYPIKVGGKWGYINRKGEVIVKPQFDLVSSVVNSGYAIVKQGSKLGLINDKGQVVLKPEYDGLYPGEEGTYAIMKAGKWGYLDKDLKEIIPLKYESIFSFSDGLANVLVGEKWGYVNTKGEMVIPPKFQFPSRFSQGLASFFDGKKMGFIGKNGEVVIKPRYDSADNFKDGGLAIVKAKGRYTCIDKTGKVIKELDIDDIGSNSIDYGYYGGHLAGFHKGNKLGYLDTNTCEIAIPPKFDRTYWFKEGLNEVFINDKWGYINEKGDVVIKPQFDWTWPFFDGVAVVKVGNKWRAIDKEGNFLDKDGFAEEPGMFIGGLAQIKKHGKNSVRDKNGERVIKPKFESFGKIKEDPGLYEAEEELGYINIQGEWVWKPTK